MKLDHPIVPLVGRLFISYIFVTSGIAKAFSWSSNVQYMNTRHLPMIPVLLAAAMLIELAGSLCLITGFHARVAAFVMFLYTTAVTVLFHNYWAATGMMAGMQETHFRKNLAIMGGLLVLACSGPGKWSLGAALRKPEVGRLATAAVALVSFAGGSLITAGLTHLDQVRADSNRVFELRVYHAVPGKMPALEARFRDKTSKLLAKHGLNVVGYWVSENAPAPASASGDTFIWVVAHSSRDEGKKNWAALFADPEFQEIVKAEQADKLVEKVDVTNMRPTDFSAIR